MALKFSLKYIIKDIIHIVTIKMKGKFVSVFVPIRMPISLSLFKVRPRNARLKAVCAIDVARLTPRFPSESRCESLLPGAFAVLFDV